jgi:hypothetical protein
MPYKPGWKSSEFWFTLVSFIFSGAFLLGVISDNSQKEDLIQETSKGLEALILIMGQLAVLFRYIKGRNEIKKIISSQPTENSISSPEQIQHIKKPRRSKGVKSRTNKTRSRKTNK